MRISSPGSFGSPTKMRLGLVTDLRGSHRGCLLDPSRREDRSGPKGEHDQLGVVRAMLFAASHSSPAPDLPSGWTRPRPREICVYVAISGYLCHHSMSRVATDRLT